MVELKSNGLMVKNSKTVKFLCSYGGKILPRSSDGQLRYVGGVIRVLSVDRSISFAELLVKLGELCGSSVILRCQLPTEDLDALISVTSDEDLANIIEEYDLASQAAAAASQKIRASIHPLKIRAFLSPPKSLKKISPPPSIYGGGSPTAEKYSSSSSSSQPSLFIGGCFGRKKTEMSRNHHQFFYNQISATSPVGYHHPVGFEKTTGATMLEQYDGGYISSQGSSSPIYLLHNGNHWQEPPYY